MKKFLIGFMVLAALAAQAAPVDDFTFTTVNITNDSHYAEQVVRGLFEGVWLDVTANKTNNIIITVDSQTIWSNAATADGYYPVRTPLYSNKGVALSDTYLNNATGATWTATNPLYGHFPLAGKVKITVEPDSKTTGTNTNKVRLMFSK